MEFLGPHGVFHHWNYETNARLCSLSRDMTPTLLLGKIKQEIYKMEEKI